MNGWAIGQRPFGADDKKLWQKNVAAQEDHVHQDAHRVKAEQRRQRRVRARHLQKRQGAVHQARAAGLLAEQAAAERVVVAAVEVVAALAEREVAAAVVAILALAVQVAVGQELERVELDQVDAQAAGLVRDQKLD